MKEKIDFPLAHFSWGKEEIEAAKSVIDSGMTTMGNKVREFESQFAAYFGAEYAVMVNSGSSANLLALAALRYMADNPLQPGDEVIVPTLSWPTTFYPVNQLGMKLVFVDIEQDTLNINANLLEDALSEKTKAVFVPHILGNPADIKKIKAFCDIHHLYLIEDNCESMGATVDNKYLGTFGICGTFSTFFSHHMSTMEGGMVTTDNEEVYQLLLSLRSHGWTRHLPENNLLCEKNNDPFYESFRFILPGYNLRPLEISGAIGIEQLKRLDQFIKIRQENAILFKSLINHIDGLSTQIEKYGVSSWFGFSLIVDPKLKSRTSIIADLSAAGVAVRPIVAGNFLRNDVLKHMNYRLVGSDQQVEHVHNNGFFIGNSQASLPDELQAVAQLLHEVTV